jgi:hypothetical protein
MAMIHHATLNALLSSLFSLLPASPFRRTKMGDLRFEIWGKDKYEIRREIERYGGKSKDMAGRTHGLSGLPYQMIDSHDHL